MSLRLEMLQVARLAPTELGESRDLVHAFLRDRLNPDGGFQDRTGISDLYYTVFGLDALIALQAEIPVDRVGGYLESFGSGGALDFVHLACLVRSWAAVRPRLERVPVEDFAAALQRYRSADGGFSQTPGAAEGTVYGAFLALGAFEDLGRPLPDPERLLESLARLRARDGSYGNHSGLETGTTTATAAAALVLRRLGAAVDRQLGMWLLDRCFPRGGFFASSQTPIPDLLSTATALHALTALHVPMDALREPCLDFVDSLWTNRGGFHATWVDDALDCEYTYYGLLALGHLSLRPS